MVLVRNSQHTLSSDNRLRETRAARSVQKQKGIPLSLLIRLIVREILLVLREPLISGQRQDRRHLALVQPWLDHGLVALVKHQDVAVGLLKQVQLAFSGVARRNEEGLEPGLDGTQSEDVVAHVVGADVGHRGKGVGSGGTAHARQLVRYAVDAVVGVQVGDHLPPVLGVGGARDGYPFPLRLVEGALLDDVEDEAAAVLRLLLAHGDGVY